MVRPIKTRYIPSDHVEITRDGIAGVVYVNQEKLTAIAYHGKAVKPDWFHKFISLNSLNSNVEAFFEGLRARQDYKEQKQAERKQFVTSIKPGDILYTSWGYDQTNVEFFQVITVKNNTITIQEIAGKTVKELGYMTRNIAPVKDSFFGPVMIKRVSHGDSVKIDNVRYAHKAGDRETFFTSSYA